MMQQQFKGRVEARLNASLAQATRLSLSSKMHAKASEILHTGSSRTFNHHNPDQELQRLIPISINYITSTNSQV
jgi:uncharacterized SAM-dependent methyltransferase